MSDKSLPRLRLHPAMSPALKQAARDYDRRLHDKYIHAPVRDELMRESLRQFPPVAAIIRMGERAGMELRRILSSEPLTPEWPKVERALSGLTPEQKLWMYQYLLQAMVRKAPGLPNQTESASKKEWDDALTKLKAARNAIDRIAAADWKVASVAGLPWNLEMQPAWKALGTEHEHLKQLQTAIEDGEHRIELDSRYQLRPERLTRRAGEQFMWRILAQPFVLYIGRVPHDAIAMLTQVALNTDPIDPERVRKDISRLRRRETKQGHTPQK